MIDVVFFDADDTLLDFRRSEAAAISKTLARLGIEPDEGTVALYSAINAEHWRMLERGEISRKELQTRRFDVLFERLGYKIDSHLTQSIYEKLLAEGHYLLPGATGLLEELSPRYRLYILSNGAVKIQSPRLEASGIRGYFRDVFISQSIGYNKPSRELFEYCFARIPSFEPKNSIIVGDSLSSDIQGGINAGIHTCWFNPKRLPLIGEIKPEFEISALSELPELLEKL